MSQWMLNQNGQIVPRRTMRKLSPEELVREPEIRKQSTFDKEIKEMYGNSLSHCLIIECKQGERVKKKTIF